jgi:hypothetical protein
MSGNPGTREARDPGPTYSLVTDSDVDEDCRFTASPGDQDLQESLSPTRDTETDGNGESGPRTHCLPGLSSRPIRDFVSRAKLRVRRATRQRRRRADPSSTSVQLLERATKEKGP